MTLWISVRLKCKVAGICPCQVSKAFQNPNRHRYQSGFQGEVTHRKVLGQLDYWRYEGVVLHSWPGLIFLYAQLFFVEEARCQVLLSCELFEEGFAIAAGGLAIRGCVV